MTKITNCLLAPSQSEMGEPAEEQGCIRCSACADACPAGLLPQQLYWYCQGGDHDKARAYHLNDCIECGACAYVCPSNIPLVQYYRQEKAELYAIDLEAKRTAEAKARFEARQERLEREKQAREAKHQAAKQRVSATDKDEIAAALARVKAKQQTATQEVEVKAGAVPDNSAVIAAREARKAKLRETKAQQQVETNATSGEADARKSAVEAAIARAKAKRAANSETAPQAVATEPAPAAATDNAPDNAVPANEPVDPRKAAVAAAIARAKAKRAAQAEAGANHSSASANADRQTTITEE